MTHQYLAGLVARLLMFAVTVFSMGFFWSRARPYLGPILSITLGLISTFSLTLDALIVYATYRPCTPRVWAVAFALCASFVAVVAYAVHQRYKERS